MGLCSVTKADTDIVIRSVKNVSLNHYTYDQASALARCLNTSVGCVKDKTYSQ